MQKIPFYTRFIPDIFCSIQASQNKSNAKDSTRHLKKYKYTNEEDPNGDYKLMIESLIKSSGKSVSLF